jgi:enoyl-CoA hydratase/carnithine racemase
MSRTNVRHVHVAVSDTHVHVKLARPERHNVLDLNTLAELAVVLETTLDDVRDNPRPLILDSEGPLFSLGVDVRELAGFTAPCAATYSRLGQSVVRALEAWPGVTIASVRGYALGVGLELALGCDIITADKNTRLGLPGLAWALVPCLGGLRRLVRRVGPHATSELFLRGEVLSGTSALQVKLIDRLAPMEETPARLISEVSEFSLSAIQAIRSLRLVSQECSDIEVEAAHFAQPFTGGECQRRLRELL